MTISGMRCCGVICVLMVALSGCSNIPDAREVDSAQMHKNRDSLRLLKIGMTASDVLQIMGSPQDYAAGPKQARHLSYWLYQTASRDLTSWALNGSNFTWLAFDGDKLVAVGAAHEVIPFNDRHPLWKPQ